MKKNLLFKEKSSTSPIIEKEELTKELSYIMEETDVNKTIKITNLSLMERGYDIEKQYREGGMTEEEFLKRVFIIGVIIGTLT